MNAYKLIGPTALLLASMQAFVPLRADDVPPAEADFTKNYKLVEKGPQGAPVTVWYTSGGELIENPPPDGRVVQQTKRIASTVPGTVDFVIPRMMNGKKVTDTRQRIGKPGDAADPGTLYFSVFDNGTMIDEPLADWLAANNPGDIYMPDFFFVGGGDLHFGVDIDEVLSAGQTFVSAFQFGDVFTIDAFGRIPELPMYVFSSTPLEYVPGSAWGGGTDLPAGTQIEYVAVHIIPTPDTDSTLPLLGMALIAITSRAMRHRC
jgi:hypothetical protein